MEATADNVYVDTTDDLNQVDNPADDLDEFEEATADVVEGINDAPEVAEIDDTVAQKPYEEVLQNSDKLELDESPDTKPHTESFR